MSFATAYNVKKLAKKGSAKPMTEEESNEPKLMMRNPKTLAEKIKAKKYAKGGEVADLPNLKEDDTLDLSTMDLEDELMAPEADQETPNPKAKRKGMLQRILAG